MSENAAPIPPLRWDWMTTKGEDRATCPDCRRPVLWAAIGERDGRRLALDPEPTPDGPFLIHDENYEGTSLTWRLARRVRSDETPHPDRLRYSPHTCPEPLP